MTEEQELRLAAQELARWGRALRTAKWRYDTPARVVAAERRDMQERVLRAEEAVLRLTAEQGDG